MVSNDRAPKGTPRAVFGQMMRFYRERAGLSRPVLSRAINMSESTIGAYETGWRVPPRDTVVLIDSAPEMRTDGALIKLWDEFEEGMTYQIFPAAIQDWVESVEAFAATLRWYEPLVVPGLLQTEGYMRAIFSTRFGITSDGIDERTTARLKRQEILAREDPPALWVIIDEGVLCRPVGGPRVMLEQVNRLIEAARHPGIQIGVVPIHVGAHEGLSGTFIIADFEDEASIGYVETVAGGQTLRERKAVAELDLTWSTLRGETLPRAASLAALEERAEKWNSAI